MRILCRVVFMRGQIQHGCYACLYDCECSLNIVHFHVLCQLGIVFLLSKLRGCAGAGAHLICIIGTARLMLGRSSRSMLLGLYLPKFHVPSTFLHGLYLPKFHVPSTFLHWSQQEKSSLFAGTPQAAMLRSS